MTSSKFLACVVMFFASNAFADPAANGNAAAPQNLSPCIGGQIEIDGVCAMPIKNNLDETEQCIFNGTLGANKKGVFVCQDKTWFLLSANNEEASQ